jgi:hypothetical protein
MIWQPCPDKDYKTFCESLKFFWMSSYDHFIINGSKLQVLKEVFQKYFVLKAPLSWDYYKEFCEQTIC